MTTIVLILAAWLLLSFPLAVIVGRWLRAGSAMKALVSIVGIFAAYLFLLAVAVYCGVWVVERIGAVS